MIQFSVFQPSLFLSSVIPDINIYTDHEAVDFRLMIYGAVLLEGRYYAFNGYATVSDISPIIEQYIAGNDEMNLVDVQLEASFGDESAELEFRVLYCDKLLDLFDPADWLRENFLTLSRSRRIAPDSLINVSWYTTEREGIMFRVYVTFLDDNGRRQTYQYVQSGNGQIAHVNNILQEYIYLSKSATSSSNAARRSRRCSSLSPSVAETARPPSTSTRPWRSTFLYSI